MNQEISNNPSPGELRRVRHHRDQALDTITFVNTHIDGIAVRELFELSASISDRPNTRVIVDFTGVSFVSSGMMSVILIVHKKLIGAGGKLFVVIPDANVETSFKVMNLHLILKLFGNLEAAREAGAR